MKISTSTVVVVLAVVLLLLSTAEGAIKCIPVLQDLTPCVAYLTNGGKPSKACCAGVTKLAGAATTTADRRAACSCIQSVTQGSNPNVAAAKALPGNCGHLHGLFQDHLNILQTIVLLLRVRRDCLVKSWKDLMALHACSG